MEKPKPGDHVMIEWPADAVSFVVPSGVSPGQTIKLRLDTLLKIVETETVTPTVAVAVAQDTATPGGLANGPDESWPDSQVPGLQHEGSEIKCERCNAIVYWHQSHRNGRWYKTNSSTDRRDFHNCVAKSAITSSGYTTDIAKNYCSCPAWKFQRVPAGVRTCKHLEAAKKAVAS